MIAMVTGSSEEYMPLHQVTLPSKQSWAQKWDIELYDKVLKGTEIAWDRIQFVYDLLMTDKYEAVGWMDSDVIVMNQDFDLPTWMKENVYNDDPRTRKIVIGHDLNSIITGTFIAVNTQHVKQFLFVVLNEGRMLWHSHPRNEQAAIRDYNNNMPYRGILLETPHNFMNAYVMKEYGWPRTTFEGDYKPGDWLIHMPGLSNERRIQIVKEMLG